MQRSQPITRAAMQFAAFAAGRGSIHNRFSGSTGYHPSCVIALTYALVYSFRVMYDDFQAIDKWTGKPLHCQYQALIVAISTRHADAVDIKFMVDDRPVWIALPHPAWVEFNRQTGKVISDPMAVQIAGHYLKWAIESGEESGREMYSLTVQETLDHLNELIEETQTSAVAG
ncbi:MAG: hypothetical protein WAN69_08580 [Candidatus Korobacteraceae bacterium]